VDDGRKVRFALTPGAPASKALPRTSPQQETFEMAVAATAEKENTNEAAHRFAKDQLKSIVERVERLEEEKKAIADDIKDVFAEAKVHGFDVKALRTIIKVRKQDTNERKEQEAIVETYMHALGMLAA
jgi:uncharacterized protein (UPF0335 family)